MTKHITPKLIQFLRSHFQLDWQGIHGAPHWARVRHNGLLLAKTVEDHYPAFSVNRKVIELFAFLHDAERQSDHSDPDHGLRAARLAHSLNGEFFQLDPRALQQLTTACESHSYGYTSYKEAGLDFVEDDLTVLVCWDADRLDLGRTGVKPDARYLCTQAAKQPEVIEYCWVRSL